MTTDKLTPPELEAALEHFHGTERSYRHIGKLVLTDGAKFLADQAGCYWLYDIVASVLPKLRDEPFAVVTFTANLEKGRGVVVIDDGDNNVLYTQRIPFTDFPLAEITLYLEDGEVGGGPTKVLLLPSEH